MAQLEQKGNSLDQLPVTEGQKIKGLGVEEAGEKSHLDKKVNLQGSSSFKGPEVRWAKVAPGEV